MLQTGAWRDAPSHHVAIHLTLSWSEHVLELVVKLLPRPRSQFQNAAVFSKRRQAQRGCFWRSRNLGTVIQNKRSYTIKTHHRNNFNKPPPFFFVWMNFWICLAKMWPQIPPSETHQKILWQLISTPLDSLDSSDHSDKRWSKAIPGKSNGLYPQALQNECFGAAVHHALAAHCPSDCAVMSPLGYKVLSYWEKYQR